MTLSKKEPYNRRVLPFLVFRILVLQLLGLLVNVCTSGSASNTIHATSENCQVSESAVLKDAGGFMDTAGY